MGTGGSGAKNKGGGAKTPSGITYEQFMSMSDDQKYQTIADVIGNPNITVPDELDDSDTTKFMYGIGMAGAPQVVSDKQLDAMPGEDLYRTVYEYPNMPPPSSSGILDQIMYDDYTQMSGKGGSAHGRALYFAQGDFSESASYGTYEKNAKVMRAKVNPGAKIASEQSIESGIYNDSSFSSKVGGTSWEDQKALYAISQGYAGWHDRYSGYTMIVDRTKTTASRQVKSILKQGTKRGVTSLNAGWNDRAQSWSEAKNTR